MKVRLVKGRHYSHSKEITLCTDFGFLALDELKQALALRNMLRDAQELLLSGNDYGHEELHTIEVEGYVFKSHGRAGCLHPTSINHRLSQLCAEMKISGVHPHTLRKTVNSQMAKLGIPLDIRQRVLNHTPQDVTSRHYDMHDYLREKRRALEAWKGVLMTIVGLGPPDTNVSNAQA